MSRFEHTVTIDVPVREAYDQWTQFEEFPRFMEGVKEVVQLDDKHLDWTAEVGGMTRSWTAEITDQTPDERIAWKSTSGADNAGAVLFRRVGPAQTRVTLRMDVDPAGPVEKAGDALGFLERRTKADLERFKEFIENRGLATGSWRGEIHGDEVRRA